MTRYWAEKGFCLIMFCLGWLWLIVAVLLPWKGVGKIVCLTEAYDLLVFAFFVVFPWFFMVVGSAQTYVTLIEDEKHD